MSMSHTTDIVDGGSSAVVTPQQQQQTSLDQQQQDQLVNLSDMADMSSEMQEDIVSIPKELILISLVSQEQALYNPKHEYYRNTRRKDAKWLQIGDSVGWSETQCKSKWKAMRDQYCRELKRFKFNAKANVKWKYFKELEFLRPYALARNYRPRHMIKNIYCNYSSNIAALNHSRSNNNNSTPNEKFTNIKIEAGFEECEFIATVTPTATNTTTQTKNDTARLLTPLTDEQLSSVMQQQQTDGNWNYLTATTATPTLTTNTAQQQQQQQQTPTNDDALYCAFVNCVAAVAASGDMQQTAQLQQQQQLLTATQGGVQQTAQIANVADEEDDDPIHTFLNIESYFEKELIGMIQQEEILYNSFHPNYRNTKLKYEVWDEIARKLKKTMKQCRLKWKALRDQYIREHKRLKNRENVEAMPRWKHYDTLNFLQKFIRHKRTELDLQIPKTELDEDIDEVIETNCDPLRVSPLQSPASRAILTHNLQQIQQQAEVQLQSLPSLTESPAQQQQQQQQQFEVQQQQQLHDAAICVVGNVSGNTDASSVEAGSGSVSGYDEMDIDTFIIGDGSDEPHDDVDADDNDNDNDADEEEEHEDPKSDQQFSHYNHNSNSNNQRAAQDDDVEFRSIKSTEQDRAHTQLVVTATHHGGISLDESLSQQQQSHVAQQQQDFHMTSNTESNTATTTSSLLNGLDNSPHVSLDVPTNALNALNVPSSCSTPTSPMTVTTAAAFAVATASDTDDEVGAFFNAVAMKIRNAKMSPVAFTDLQIDILRVINGALRHH